MASLRLQSENGSLNLAACDAQHHFSVFMHSAIGKRPGTPRLQESPSSPQFHMQGGSIHEVLRVWWSTVLSAVGLGVRKTWLLGPGQEAQLVGALS